MAVDQGEVPVAALSKPAHPALTRAGVIGVFATIWVIFASLVLAPPASAQPDVSAAANSTPPVVTGWLPYWSIQSSADRVVANADLFADVSPFWLKAAVNKDTGKLEVVDEIESESLRNEVLTKLRSTGRPVIPSIVDGTARQYMAAVLTNPTTRAEHVNDIVEVVLANGYDGIDLDYEKFAFSDGQNTWATTKPAWVAFVTELSARLHSYGKLLTVAVPFSGYWVYDHAAMGQLTDGVRIMTYDWSVSTPGAVAPMWWLEREMDVLAKIIPPAKTYMGVPLYGRDWVRRDDSGQPLVIDAEDKPADLTACPTGDDAPALGTSAVIASRFDSHLADPSITVTSRELVPNDNEWKILYSKKYSAGGETCSVLHEAWLTDENTVADRVRAIIDAGMAGAALWAVGFEDAEQQWPLLREIAQNAATAPPPVPAGRQVKIPTDAPGQTVFGTLSAVSPQANGYLTAWTCGETKPPTSVLNYQANRTTPNTIAVKADANGDICVATSATTHILFDQVAETDSVTATAPERIRDTGEDTMATEGREGLVPARGTIEIDTGYPNSLVMGVLTVSSPQNIGFTSARPCAEAPTDASLNNYVRMRDNANFAAIRTDADGKFCVTTTAAARLIWDQSVVTTDIVGHSPVREADSRSNGAPPVPAGSVWQLDLGYPGQLLMGNLTVASPDRTMITTLYPCGPTRPDASHNYVYAGETMPTFGLVQADAEGKVCVYTSATTHLVWDQSVETTLFTAHEPDRRLDSRNERVW
jgi:spore germination protein YaaH